MRDKTLKSKFSTNEKIINKIKIICDNSEIVFVCSNNISAKLFLKEKFSNVFLYEDNVIKTINRDYSDEEYWKYCLTEFSLLSMSEKINIFTNYSWISNFISYGILNNKFGVVNPYKNNLFVENHGLFTDSLL